MPIYDAKTIPAKVASTTKEPEIAEWLKTGPVLGAHKPIHVQRREHDVFIDKNPPPVGQVEFLGIAGPEQSRCASITHPAPVPRRPQP